MAIAAQTRADLRTRLQYHTDSKFTSPTDQDYYLNNAELDVFKDWRKFDPGLFRPARDTVATDSSGILLVDKEFTRMEYLEDENGKEYKMLPDVNAIRNGTGYVFLGFDQTNKKRQIKVLSSGSALNTITLHWYNIAQMLMGTATDAESAIPNDFRSLITLRAAFLYYQDKGTAFLQVKENWLLNYERELAKAVLWYKNVGKGVQFVPSVDPDAGNGYGQSLLRQQW